MAGGLFQIENPMSKAMQGMSAAGVTLSHQQRKGGGTAVTETSGPEKSAGGALGAGLGGAASGSAAGIPGAIGGAVIGLLGYFLG
jgi:hypothetical protein